MCNWNLAANGRVYNSGWDHSLNMSWRELESTLFKWTMTLGLRRGTLKKVLLSINGQQKARTAACER